MKYNYISFSLWGDKEIYTVGAVRNAALAREIYPGWRVIVYYDDTVPAMIIQKLNDLGVILMDMTHSGIYGLFWRFLAADISDSGHVIFRDTDSRLSLREKLAVEEWMSNNDLIHVMRDHPVHDVPFGAEKLSILGGMWGIKSGVVEMTKAIHEFCKERPDQYGIDQSFLENLYKEFQYSMTVHDEFFDKKPFPSRREGYRFIGERIDENEAPFGEDWKEIRAWNKIQNPSLFQKIKTWIRKILK
ncbi:hypothetical protein [Pedobacter gandavensis]|uniref:Glycosyltransferase n=1 Tax=Pedobacter gandavensis TaxID=2679963 RepID=A0ABR6F2R6_9SPHI|nr:hypothetical protein [Pedobacter gandavensis]MBB2150973.1 hypothetical protein [Pedobacter gandavensis]